MADIKPRYRFNRHMQNHGEEEDAELWLVSYADMMTLLFGFFVILFSMSVIDDKKLEEVSKQIAKTLGAKQDVNEQKTVKLDANISNPEEYMSALKTLGTLLNLGNSADIVVQRLESVGAVSGDAKAAKEILKDTLVGNKGVGNYFQFGDNSTFDLEISQINLPASEIFNSGSVKISDRGMDLLNEINQSLKKIDGLVKIEVIGHTDSSPIGNPGSFLGSNWVLSASRAAAVAEYLIAGGLDRKQISTSGKADTEPLFTEIDEKGKVNVENQLKNRRVQLIIQKRKAL